MFFFGGGDNDTLGGGNSNIFYFHPEYLGKIPMLTNIFQRGWNHQLVPVCLMVCFGWIILGDDDMGMIWIYLSQETVA